MKQPMSPGLAFSTRLLLLSLRVYCYAAFVSKHPAFNTTLHSAHQLALECILVIVQVILKYYEGLVSGV